MKLHTSDEQFESLHRVCDKARTTSKAVTVDRQALINLLMDHSNLVAQVERIDADG
jgi:hypothetical protein